MSKEKREAYGFTAKMYLLVWTFIYSMLFVPAALSQELNPQTQFPLDEREINLIGTLYANSDSDLDYAEAKLLIEQLKAPFSFSTSKVLKQIDQMVSRINEMLPVGASEAEKLNMVRKFLHDKGAWNDHKPFKYDFDDPLGTDNPKGSFIYNYIDTKKGNCVSMPILFMILADRIGLDVTLTNAPKHLLLYYHDRQSGKNILLETTSGANPARLDWIAQQFNINDKALQSGIYLRKLTKRQSIALMTNELMGHFYIKQHYYTVIALADMHLHENPLAIDAILARVSSFGWLHEHVKMRYKRFFMVPDELKGYADHVARTFVLERDRAISLGWKMETPAERSQYLEILEKSKRS